MARKSKNRKSLSSRNALLLCLALFSLVIGVIFIRGHITSQNEKDSISLLKSEVLRLQPEFNKVANGWVYDEYCRGYGTDVARNNKKICYVVLLNESDKNDTNYNLYLSLLEEYNYRKIRPTEELPSEISGADVVRVTSFSSPISNSTGCKFSDAEYALDKDSGFYFQCATETRNYYFEQR